MPEALAVLRSGLEFLEKEVRAHSEVEEQVLYVALKRHLPRRTIDRMLDEHQDSWRAMDLVAKALAASEPRPNDVRWHGSALVDLLRRHIDEENNALFMMAAQMLFDPECRDLARAIDALLHTRKQCT